MMDLSGYTLETLHQNGEFALCRARASTRGSCSPSSVLISMPASQDAPPDRIEMLKREWSLRTELDTTFAIRPLALAQHQGREVLILEDQEGDPLPQIFRRTSIKCALESATSPERGTELRLFLRLAKSLATALGEVHRRGIIHKNIKPAHVLANAERGKVWLTGFGIASRVTRERQEPEPPQAIGGTLPYMAPEQTGRMNRSIDARSDLYALGVTLYEMFTGSLPFDASEPMEWVHCHIARQPLPPSGRVTYIPAVLSSIIMKLLAKTPEERYQTAAGLERDLGRCLTQYEAEGRIDDFALGERDTTDRLLIPEKLYGRACEVKTLLAAFDRIVRGGEPELVLLSGYSGIGKSSVVNELHRVLLPARGLFAAGKFDQFKRDIPYSTLAQAFQSLVRSLLARSDGELAEWRTALREALGSNGHLMVDLVPELKLIMGEQAPPPELPPPDAQRRFQRALRSFLTVFARPEHPLTLFLDDLQWLDTATVDLLGELLTQADLRHLLLIGAYRDNEVTSMHPLMRRLTTIRQAGGHVHDIKIGALSSADLSALVEDSIHCDAQRAAPLVSLVLRKTGGNPFFAIQFLKILADEGLLAFDHEQSRWSWDLDGIDAKQYTDNIADLMAGKLTRLKGETQEVLRMFACLGNQAETAVLSIVLGTNEDGVHQVLWEGVDQHLIERRERSYRFGHDRVQEAAYALIPEGLRAEAHLKIGRMLETHTPPAQRDEAIFEIVNQLNRGALLIVSDEECYRLAELNLAAARRAKASSAHASALTYLSAGTATLPKGSWAHRQELAFELELHASDCEVCTGALQEAAERLSALVARAVGTGQRCAVACRRVDLHTMRGASEDAVAAGLECLRHVGIDLPAHPTDAETRGEYERIWFRLGSRAIENVVDLPLMQDSEARAVLDLLVRLSMPALYTDDNLYALSVCRAANLALERGNSDAATYSYAILGLIASARFGHRDAGYRFGKLACDLLERHGWNHVGGRTYFFLAAVIPWTRPFGEAIDAARRAFRMAKEHDPAFAGFASRALTTTLLLVGHPLDQVERQAEEGAEFVRQFGFLLDRNSAPLALVRSLRGRTAEFGRLDDDGLTEHEFEQGFTSHPTRAFTECYYWIRKLRARFLAGDYASAIDAAKKAERWYARSATLALFLTEMTEFHFYAALSCAARCEPIGPDPYAKHEEALARHEQRLQQWAAHCPQNFEDRAALVGAEIARLEGRELDAERLYEQAIRAAREKGFLHNESLANELAARFYAARGFETIAHAYLRNARRGYLRWGADGKVRNFDRLHPHLSVETATPAPSGTLGTLVVEQLDLATVTRVLQAVSGEMVLEKLLDTLTRAAVEHAGAQRALLLLSRGGGQRVAAEAMTGADSLAVRLCDEAVTATIVPETIIRYVAHSGETVILDDAAIQNPFSADPYIVQRDVRSVLCLPLSNRGRLIGVLYLENNLAARTFAPSRTAVLKLLASQAAISLENARLYRDLAEREGRIRRLVEANIIGIAFYSADGRILEANEAFLRIVGYSRDDLASHPLSWVDMTPPEWPERIGSLQPCERELFRKDGSRVPVLIGVANFEDEGDLGVAFVLDLSERNRAQEAFSRARAELARVSRMTALSALSASIAHEVNQPLSGIITNAGTCLLMLDATPPNLGVARETARRTIRDGNRASEVIARLRALFSKREFAFEPLDLNEVAREVIALCAKDFTLNRVILRVELAHDLPPVAGDRVELQQVILNLLRNAMDAMADVHDKQRELLVTTGREDNGHVRLSARDAGVGLPADGLDSLFDPFYTTKEGGMGIGLFVSRSIVERHHGRVWAERNQGAPGATFSFSIPHDQPS